MLRQRFGWPEQLQLTPRYNIAPGQEASVVIAEDSVHPCLMRWGLIPIWAKDESISSRLINARAETLAAKPAFRTSFTRRRCLVLADGFYEWARDGRAKQPVRIVMRDRQPFAFAGLWERWYPQDGPELRTFTIITTEPNELLRPIHNRMPVILSPADYDRWLDQRVTRPGDLRPFCGHTRLKRWRSTQSTAWPTTRGTTRRLVSRPSHRGDGVTSRRSAIWSGFIIATIPIRFPRAWSPGRWFGSCPGIRAGGWLKQTDVSGESR